MSIEDLRTMLPQRLLPKRALTELAGRIAAAENGARTTALIERFIRRYGVNMAEAANPDPAAYKSFNEFFTRPLKPAARPLAKADWICPVDGAISAFGAIQADQVFQAKGHGYSTTALVGGDAKLAARFQDGHFATLYLSPKDYHRIHMPCGRHPAPDDLGAGQSVLGQSGHRPRAAWAVCQERARGLRV